MWGASTVQVKVIKATTAYKNESNNINPCFCQKAFQSIKTCADVISINHLTRDWSTDLVNVYGSVYFSFLSFLAVVDFFWVWLPLWSHFDLQWKTSGAERFSHLLLIRSADTKLCIRFSAVRGCWSRSDKIQTAASNTISKQTCSRNSYAHDSGLFYVTLKTDESVSISLSELKFWAFNILFFFFFSTQSWQQH